MVYENNSTNINKNEHPPLTSIYWTQNKQWHTKHCVWHLWTGLCQVQNVAMLNRIMYENYLYQIDIYDYYYTEIVQQRKWVSLVQKCAITLLPAWIMQCYLRKWKEVPRQFPIQICQSNIFIFLNFWLRLQNVNFILASAFYWYSRGAQIEQQELCKNFFNLFLRTNIQTSQT